MRRFAFLLLVAALSGCSSPTVSRIVPGPEPLLAGAAEVDITPPPGLRMSGYFHERLNTGTKDPLKAKAIVFRQGEVRAALVFCDLIGVPVGVTVRAREQAEKKTGIPAAHIGIAATHTHTGPLFFGSLAKVLRDRAVAAHGKDPQAFDYASLLIERIVEAIRQADASLRPARFDGGAFPEATLSFHRRFHMKDGTLRTNPGALNPAIVKAAGPIDPDVSVLLARDGRSGQAFASLSVFALHCDTVGGTEYSADYPGFIEREIRPTMGDAFISLFGAGTCGNLNHIDVTKKERRSAAEIGATLGRRILAEIPRLRPLPATSLGVRNCRVDLPLRKYSLQEVADARANVDKIGGKETAFLDQVRIATLLHLQDLPQILPLEVQAFRLSRDTAVVTLPGEVFVELGLAIKKASPFRNTLVVELANDNPAYIPTREAFAQGGYEVVNSRIEPGGGERLVEAAIGLLQELAHVE